MCGEKLSPAGAARLPLGSPPRVRGKESIQIFLTWNVRITPACAGKRMVENVNHPYRRDHPRVCGEKYTIFYLLKSGLGSPPRVRGKDAADFWIGDIKRITPACAGKRRLVSGCGSGAEDHPRVCGEK